MKKIIASILALSLFCSASAHSAEPAAAAAAAATAAESDSNWQNWAFAGGAVAIAIVCAIIVSLDGGPTK